ncbi:uncharacterized protein LOC134980882 isoform X3 [Pseudophryne corroboree]|uniref:uncharacterized protein LOC134980882 isoform X3 n=1 Tax=Pseudophryne corroboree TaxID=495146 RepID=UPI00308203B7
MDFSQAQTAILNLLGRVSPGVLPKLMHWVKNSSDIEKLTPSNADVLLHGIADDLRGFLPVEAMVGSENQAMENLHKLPKPTLHVDAFLYNDDTIDLLCDEGKMSRNYCLSCGSRKTAPIDFLSHSFSIVELKYLFQHVLPDLSEKTLVDVGSRLGAVLYAVYHSDICSQQSLLHHADVVVLNNVFEYFLDTEEQIRTWIFLRENIMKKECLLVTVPSLKESLHKLQINLQLNQWVEEIELDPDIFLGSETDRESLSDIHLYRVL